MQRKSGPRTARGRAAVRHNSLTHGLRTADILMPGELRADWHNFHDRVVDQLAPDSPILCEVAEQIASILWRLRRVPRAEAALVRPGAMLLPGEISSAGRDGLLDVALGFLLPPPPGDSESDPYEEGRAFERQKRQWIDAHSKRAEPSTPNPGDDPITRLMTPAQTPLEVIVRYESHLYKQLYRALAYYDRQRASGADIMASSGESEN
jgi:hypothetical protein